MTQTILRASSRVDAGNIIAKARYLLVGTETEDEVRCIDDRMTIKLLRGTLLDVAHGGVLGVAQCEEKRTYWPRRRGNESEIDPGQSIVQLFDFLRALPEEAPAFFEHKGRRYTIKLAAMDDAPDVNDKAIEIIRYY